MISVDLTMASASSPRRAALTVISRNVDLVLARRIALPGGHALELRAEVFNLKNTTTLGTPNTVLGAANFGTITTSFDPRVMQVALKFVF